MVDWRGRFTRLAGLLIVSIAAAACGGGAAASTAAAGAAGVGAAGVSAPAAPALRATFAAPTAASTIVPGNTTQRAGAGMVAEAAPRAASTQQPTPAPATRAPTATPQPYPPQLMPERSELPVVPGLTPVPLPDPAVAGRAIDEFLLKYQKITGLDAVVHVEVGGKTALDKAYGYANLPHNRAMTTDTRFRIQQLSGEFTAAAVLMLQEQGKLKVTDPVCQYVAACPAAWKGITIRHLLTHTDGLPDYAKLPGAADSRTKALSLQEVVQKFRNQPLVFAPGSQWAYNQSGLVLASAIIERASGMPYERYLKQAILQPLGLKNTGLSDPGPNLADGNAGVPAVTTAFANGYGAAGLYSTAGDLARWAHALLGEGALPERVRKELLADQVHFGRTLDEGWYGYAITGYPNRGTSEWGGIAGADGFAGTLYFEPQARLVVVELFNTSRINLDTIATAVEKKLFGD